MSSNANCDQRGSNPVALTFTVVFGLSLMIVDIFFLYNLVWGNKTHKKRDKGKRNYVAFANAIKRCTIGALTFYMVSVCCTMISMVVCNSDDMIMMLGAAGCCALLALTFVMIVFTVRFHLTFVHTPFEASNTLKYYTLFAICVIFFGFFILGLGWVAGFIQFGAAQVGLTFVLLFLVLNTMMLLFLFISKLKGVVNVFLREFGMINSVQLSQLNKSASVTPEPPIDFAQNNRGSGADFDGKNIFRNMRSLTRLISDMNRYTIVVSFAICSSTLSFVTFATWITIQARNVPLQWFMMILLLDGTINSVCLLFQFEFGKKYYKTICGKLHVKCEDRYVDRTNNKLQQVEYQLERIDNGDITVSVSPSPAGTPEPVFPSQLKSNVDFAINPDTNTSNNTKANDTISSGPTMTIPSTIQIQTNDKGSQETRINVQTQSTIDVVAQKSAEMELTNLI